MARTKQTKAAPRPPLSGMSASALSHSAQVLLRQEIQEANARMNALTQQHHNHSHSHHNHSHGHSHQHAHAVAPPVTDVSPTQSVQPAAPLSLEENDVKMFLDGARIGLIDHMSALLDTGHVQSSHIDQAFLIAAEHGHAKLVTMLLPKISSLYCATPRLDTAVHLSARHGHYDIVAALIKTGCPIDAFNSDGATPLYVAVDHNQAHIVALLLEQKANVNSMDHEKNSILHIAAANGYAPIVLMILKAGAHTNLFNAKDETPLEVSKNSEICRIILEFLTQRQHQHANSAQSQLQSQSGHQFALTAPSASSSSSNATQPESSPHMQSPHLPVPISPFRELPAGASSYLFWTAMGVGKDSYMFQNFGVYPFDRLNDTERIIVLTEVAEAMSGYKTDLKCSLLNESALYAVFALMKARIKKELEDSELNDLDLDDDLSHGVVWRKRVMDAYEQVYAVNVAQCGLSLDCYKRSVWNTVVNLLARSLFGESFWEKKRMFLSPNGFERMAFLKHFRVEPAYFHCRLPNTASVEIQLTFKKLITMSKTFLCDEPERMRNNGALTAAAGSGGNGGCFCPDCIAELEVPLTFKLQFLEEAAAEKRKQKNKHSQQQQNQQRKNSNHMIQSATATITQSNISGSGVNMTMTTTTTTHSAAMGPFHHPMMQHHSQHTLTSYSHSVNANYDDGYTSSRARLDELVLSSKKELKNFWCSISVEEKWCLTEMSTAELSDIISGADEWETLRAALDSYTKYAYEEDVLEISEQCVTIADDMCEEKNGMQDVLEAMIDAIETLRQQHKTKEHQHQHSHNQHTHTHSHSHGHAHNHHSLSDDEWDKRGRQMLENYVLSEFARKIAAQYLLKKQESRAQQVALELELELMQEEEDAARKQQSQGKKGKKKQNKQKKDKKLKESKSTNNPPPRPESRDSDEQEEEVKEPQKPVSEIKQPEPPTEITNPAAVESKTPVVVTTNAKKRNKRGNSTVMTLEQKLSNATQPTKPPKSNASAPSPAPVPAPAPAPAPTVTSAPVVKPATVIKPVATSLELRATAVVDVNNPFAMLDEQVAKAATVEKPTPVLVTESKPRKEARTVEAIEMDSHCLAMTEPPVSRLSIDEIDGDGVTHIYPLHSLPPHLADLAQSQSSGIPISVASVTDGLLMLVSKENLNSALQNRQVTVARQLLSAAKHVKPVKTAVFLLNSTDRLVHGPYCVTALAGENLNTSSFSRVRPIPKGYSSSVATVMDLKAIEALEPVPDSAVRTWINEGTKAKKLELRQVQQLIQLQRTATQTKAAISTAAAKVNAATTSPTRSRVGSVTSGTANSSTNLPIATALAVKFTPTPVANATSAAAKFKPVTKVPQTASSSTTVTAGSIGSSTSSVSTTAANKSKSAETSTATPSIVPSTAQPVKNVWKLRQEAKHVDQPKATTPTATAAVSAASTPVAAPVVADKPKSAPAASAVVDSTASVNVTRSPTSWSVVAAAKSPIAQPLSEPAATAPPAVMEDTDVENDVSELSNSSRNVLSPVSRTAIVSPPPAQPQPMLHAQPVAPQPQQPLMQLWLDHEPRSLLQQSQPQPPPALTSPSAWQPALGESNPSPPLSLNHGFTGFLPPSQAQQGIFGDSILPLHPSVGLHPPPSLNQPRMMFAHHSSQPQHSPSMTQHSFEPPFHSQPVPVSGLHRTPSPATNFGFGLPNVNVPLNHPTASAPFPMSQPQQFSVNVNVSSQAQQLFRGEEQRDSLTGLHSHPHTHSHGHGGSHAHSHGHGLGHPPPHSHAPHAHAINLNHSHAMNLTGGDERAFGFPSHDPALFVSVPSRQLSNVDVPVDDVIDNLDSLHLLSYSNPTPPPPNAFHRNEMEFRESQQQPRSLPGWSDSHSHSSNDSDTSPWPTQSMSVSAGHPAQTHSWPRHEPGEQILHQLQTRTQSASTATASTLKSSWDAQSHTGSSSVSAVSDDSSSLSSVWSDSSSLFASLPAIPNRYGSNFLGSSIWGAATTTTTTTTTTKLGESLTQTTETSKARWTATPW